MDGRGTGSARSARILLVEDDAVLRESLALVLRATGYDVTEAGDGLSALKAARHWGADVAIIDVGLPPGPDGFAVARRLTADQRLGVLFLTAADAPRQRLEGFAAGADDYVTKPFDLAELLARVRALLRRLGHDSDPLRVGELVVDEAAHRVTWRQRPVEVSATELALLAELVRHHRQVLSKRRLLSLVWGHGRADANLVEVNVSRLRRKLATVDAALIRTVHGSGYILEVP